MTPEERRADTATLLARFSDRLHASGVAVSPDQTVRLAQLVELGVPRTVDELYWCARVSLLRSHADVPVFDAIFALVFRGMADDAESRGDSNEVPPHVPEVVRDAFEDESAARSGARFEASEGDGDDDEDARPIPTLASPDERLTDIDFARLTTDELAELAPLLQLLTVEPPLRMSRRRRRHPRGDRLDVRASLRHSIRSAGDPVAPVRRSRKRKPRRLVAILDISGSMEPYARAYLHLLWGAATRARAEVFVFSTRLTRLTRALRHSDPDRALAHAATLMPDWSGGTRIGLALRAFMDGYGRRGMAHGAVVLIVSDGWERDDPAQLGRQMADLAGRAHRIVWANPRSAAPGFEPLAGGMHAALPHIDAFVSGHSAGAMAQVVHEMSASLRRADRLPGAGSRTTID